MQERDKKKEDGMAVRAMSTAAVDTEIGEGMPGRRSRGNIDLLIDLVVGFASIEVSLLRHVLICQWLHGFVRPTTSLITD